MRLERTESQVAASGSSAWLEENMEEKRPDTKPYLLMLTPYLLMLRDLTYVSCPPARPWMAVASPSKAE